MKFLKNKKIILTLIFTAIVIFALGLGEFLFLRNAHSTFANYYKFRGCVELIEKTDTYGICKLSSGQTIKIVLFNGKWYLNGDLPYPGFNFL